MVVFVRSNTTANHDDNCENLVSKEFMSQEENKLMLLLATSIMLCSLPPLLFFTVKNRDEPHTTDRIKNDFLLVYFLFYLVRG